MSSLNDLSWLRNPRLGESRYKQVLLEEHGWNLLERASCFDLGTYLNGAINTKMDRASMAYSLESRAPLQDFRLVEWARKLPTEFKCDGDRQKILLKEILGDYLPRQLFERPKSGFGLPLARWFREDLNDFVRDSLTMENLSQIENVDSRKVLSLVAAHQRSDENNWVILWRLLVLVNWLRAWKERRNL